MPQPEIQVLVDNLDEAFDRKAWHGPNLRNAIRGVTAAEASWRPGPRRHNIWELTLHAAYWKYVVRRKLTGAKRSAFALKGSNFFSRPVGEITERMVAMTSRVLLSSSRAYYRHTFPRLATPAGG